MMSNPVNNRGRAYKCKQCPKVLRKGRMVSHILKHHIPMDRVPFSCTLCMFRCQNQQTLVDHIEKYKRHTDAEQKLGFKPDYCVILKRAENPYHVGEQDMIQLSREESYQWHARNAFAYTEETLEECDDGEEDTVMLNGLTLPSWISNDVTTSKKSPCPYIPTPINLSQQGVVFSSAPVTTLTTTISTAGISKSTPNLAVPLNRQFFNASIRPFPTINLQDLGSTAIPVANQTVPSLPIVNTPRSIIATAYEHATPCQDENILPNFVCHGSSELSPENPLPSAKGPEEEPPNKRRKEEEDLGQALRELTNAISAGFEKVVMAIDSNTRMLRNQSQSVEKAVSELSRIERKLHTLERSLVERNKENDHPSTRKF